MVRGWLVILVLGLLLAFGMLAPAGALAAEGHPAGAGHDSELGGHPALDLAIWTFVVFLVLLFVLGRFAWRPMLEGLQQRELNIRSAIDEAERTRQEAQRLRAELQVEMDHAAEKVHALMDAARRDAQQATDEMLARARVEVQKERDRLRREIDMARDHALQQIWDRTAQLATLVAGKAIRRQLTPDDHRRLVEDAIAELRQAGKERERELAGVLS
jgi:F-type H+-transporting ATPase subunit b